MTKKDFITKLSQSLACSKSSAEQQVNAVFDLITEVLHAGDEILIPGFGRFTITHRAARIGRNPQTGKELKIPAKAVPVFRAASQLKARVSKIKPQKKK